MRNAPVALEDARRQAGLCADAPPALALQASEDWSPRKSVGAKAEAIQESGNFDCFPGSPRPLCGLAMTTHFEPTGVQVFNPFGEADPA